MRIDVWSDVICPFCFIGKRKLELALAETGIRADVDWHSFELRPGIPRSFGQPLPVVMSTMYGVSVAQVLGVLTHEQHAAEHVGLEFNWRDAKPGNTFDAHRLIHLGKSQGRGDQVNERLMRAYFTDGEEIGEPEVLRRLAVEAGLDGDTVESVLGSDAFAADVRADQRRAGELGIRGVPHFVINGRSVISGARDVAVFVDALHAESATATPTDSTGGPVCADGFCQVHPA